MPNLRHRLPVLAVALLVAASAKAGTLLSQTFDDVGALPTDGWLLINSNPDPAYKLDWFQGNPDVFMAHGGPDGGYVASTWGATAAGAQLANWLITPEFSTASAGTVTFWLRGADDPGYVDTVRFGFGSGGGNFALRDAIAACGDWTEYSASFAAAGAGSTTRFAIEQTGPGDLADYVGIDDFSIQTRAASTVPEPLNAVLLATGLLGLAAWRRRSAR